MTLKRITTVATELVLAALISTPAFAQSGPGGLPNGNFDTGMLPPWTFSEYHSPGTPTPRATIPYWVDFLNGGWYRPLRLDRGSVSDGGAGGVSQSLNYEVSGCSSLRLQFDVAVKQQGFTGDLTRYREYPAKVILSYRDIWGNAQTFIRAFYLAASRADAFAERIAPNSVVHRSYELMAVWPQIATITGIRLEGSGWSWDSYFDNVFLIVAANELPIGYNVRYADANRGDAGGNAWPGLPNSWHRETFNLPTRQAFAQSFAQGVWGLPTASANSWAWVGRAFRVYGTTPRAAVVKVPGEYRAMVSATSGYPVGIANYRWTVEAVLRDLTTGDPGDVTSVPINAGASSSSLPHDEVMRFNVVFPERTLWPGHEYRVEIKISTATDALLVGSAAADFYGRGDPSSSRYLTYDSINIEWK